MTDVLKQALFESVSALREKKTCHSYKMVALGTRLVVIKASRRVSGSVHVRVCACGFVYMYAWERKRGHNTNMRGKPPCFTKYSAGGLLLGGKFLQCKNEKNNISLYKLSQNHNNNASLHLTTASCYPLGTSKIYQKVNGPTNS